MTTQTNDVRFCPEQWVGGPLLYYPAKLFRPHSHCPSCWGEEYSVVDGVQKCTICHSAEPMIVCTPIVCASS